MINNVTLVGRLTKDVQYRTTPNGVGVALFTLAVNRTFTNAQGEREADFINCVTFRKQAENVANFLRKGSLAGIVGRIQTRSYDNNEGQRVFVTEVVCDSVQFLEPKSQNSQQNYNSGYTQNNGYSQGNYNKGYNNTPQQQSNGYTPPKQQQQAYTPPQNVQQQQNGYVPPQQQQQPSYAPPIKQNNVQKAQSENPFKNASVEIDERDLPF